MSGASDQLQSVSVSVRGLRKSYNGVEVLHGVSLEVRAGEIVTLIGANGAGKTTLLKTLSGLLTPRAGRALFEGKDLLDRRPELGQ